MTTTEALPGLYKKEKRKNDSRDMPAGLIAPDEGRMVTLEEYWAKWYENPYPDIDVSYEWNNGRLEAKPLPNAPQVRLYNWFLDILRCYLRQRGNAQFINLETGFVMTIEDPEEPSGERVQVRKPDIGVILNSNPVSWGEISQRHFAGVCDSVIEAVSDSTHAEVLRDTEEKKHDYALAGVKEYFILDPTGQHMHFYRLAPARYYEEIQPDAEGVIRSEVLPGFQFRLRDLNAMPELEDLALDDPYRGYVLLKYQAAVAAAAAATVSRQEAEQLADAEKVSRQEAEQLADAKATALREAEERIREMAAELDRLRRRSS